MSERFVKKRLNVGDVADVVACKLSIRIAQRDGVVMTGLLATDNARNADDNNCAFPPPFFNDVSWVRLPFSPRLRYIIQDMSRLHDVGIHLYNCIPSTLWFYLKRGKCKVIASELFRHRSSAMGKRVWCRCDNGTWTYAVETFSRFFIERRQIM